MHEQAQREPSAWGGSLQALRDFVTGVVRPVPGSGAAGAFDPSRQVVLALLNVLTVMALLAVVAGWPFWVRKEAVTVIFLSIAGVTWSARALALRGRHVLAMHLYALFVVAFTLPIMALSAQLTAPTMMMMTVLPAYAAVCGPRPALGAALLYLIAATAVQLGRQQGLPLPIFFPTPPGAQITAAAIGMLANLGPLAMLFERLVQSLGRLEGENRQRRQAEAELEASNVRLRAEIDERRRIEAELARHRDHLEQLVAQRTADLASANASLVQARDAAEAAVRAKSAFLANMSHEIRTPMNAIVGMTHLALRADPPPAQRDYLGKIRDASRHLQRLIDDILDFSRLEAGELKLDPIGFEIGPAIGRVTALLGERARAKALDLRVELAEDLPRWLVGDVLRLEQVLLNLGANAVKFTERGAVVISVAPLRQEGERVWLRFEVRDSGIGIEARDLPGLFQRFHQVDSSITRRYGGTGLGLAISRRLVEAMGGEIGVASEPGVGSVFSFTLPFGRGLPPPAAQPGSSAEIDVRPPDLAGLRVLVVEDNVLNQEVARELLGSAGCCVDVVDDGAQALERLARQPCDLVLMDMQMPVMDGLSATRAIRAQPALAGLPVIAMTANALAQDRLRCLEAGMNDHIAKPFEPEALWALLQRWAPPRPAAVTVPPAPAPAGEAAAPGGAGDRPPG
ncbi:MAG: response regulator [Burkholderiaceae bacterium]|nr:response regulator [Burkholderiaceae bacterium]